MYTVLLCVIKTNLQNFLEKIYCVVGLSASFQDFQRNIVSDLLMLSFSVPSQLSDWDLQYYCYYGIIARMAVILQNGYRQ